MRTERPEPWGFDRYDPRLTIRQQAKDAQRKYDPDVPEPDAGTAVDEPTKGEREPESVGAAPR
jgi:hypothetical protein